MMAFILHHEQNPSRLQTHFILETRRPSDSFHIRQGSGFTPDGYVGYYWVCGIDDNRITQETEWGHHREAKGITVYWPFLGQSP